MQTIDLSCQSIPDGFFFSSVDLFCVYSLVANGSGKQTLALSQKHAAPTKCSDVTLLEKFCEDPSSLAFSVVIKDLNG